MKIKVSRQPGDNAHLSMELLGPFCKQIWQILAGPGPRSGMLMLLKLTQVSWDDRWLPAHQLDSEEVSNPGGLKEAPACIRGRGKIIDTRDYADLRNTLGTRKFSECKRRQPREQEALHHDGSRDKARGV